MESMTMVNFDNEFQLTFLSAKKGQLIKRHEFDEQPDFDKIEYLDDYKINKSLTKKVKYRAQISTLKWVKSNYKTKVVAIGGINDKNYKKLLLNNADFLAISDYIWNNKKLNPQEATKKLL